MVRIFSHSVGCFFAWKTMLFAIQKLPSFTMSHLLTVGLSAGLSVSWSECPFCANEFKPILPFLCYQRQGIWSYDEVLDPFGVEFCAVWWVWIYFLSSTCSHPVWWSPLVEDAVSSPAYIFYLTVKNQVSTACELSLCLHFDTLNQCVWFCSSPMLLLLL